MTTSRLALSAATALTAVAALVAAGCGGNDDVPPDAVAIVDGTVITKASLEELLGRAKKSYAADKRAFPKAGTTEYTSLQAQAVAYLVQREEYAREAEALGIEITDEQIDDRIAEVTKQYFNGDKAKLAAQLKQQGYTDEAFRDDIVAQLTSEKIYEKLTSEVEVTDADVKAYYDANKAQYTTPESRTVRHILVKTKAQADDIAAQLAAGGSFEALAKKYSQDPGSKDSGGKLTISKGQTVAPFEKAAFALRVNELSAPVKTQFGYHLIEALGAVKPAAAQSLASVKDQIRAQLLEEKKNTAVQDWSNGLTDEYKGKITYATGYEPPDVASDDSSTETTDG